MINPSPWCHQPDGFDCLIDYHFDYWSLNSHWYQLIFVPNNALHNCLLVQALPMFDHDLIHVHCRLIVLGPHLLGSGVWKRILTLLIQPNVITSIKIHKVNSVQEAFTKCFAVHILKFEILQITWNKWNEQHQTLSFQFFINKWWFWWFLFCFFVWFARFQILICEPQSIWRKVLVLSWLYN